MDLKSIYEGKKFGEILFCEPLKDYTTWGIGGPADVLVKPHNEKELQDLLIFNNENKIHTTVIGRGSNLLITDKGIRGCVLVLADNYDCISLEDTELTVLAGTKLNKAALYAIENKLTGMEEVSGIPGSVGGAVAMNAGAYNREIKDICINVKAFDLSGNEYNFTNDEMNFSYRHSKIFEQDLIVSSATFKLFYDTENKAEEKYDDYTNRRETKQPLDKKSAGSTFKRPEGSYASKLIDECGLRGYRVGDCQVSEKHCGFIINTGDATSREMLDFIEEVAGIVKEKTGFTLEREVKLIGDL
ncbi:MULTISPECIES: UDP-N-acetylmuramate dehydrogenase [Anaerococcus]|jgi:UDP-N-acetylmuramate dehydrogenase|uniref:UDP-N-acetylenolpyruvoylglucosamine reductase n=1 Tax=Anaerococcus nagyae TaxID=1755241 RepID=A0A3E2TJJ4_9FIRM|nr:MULTISPECIES: UDP-N-acetylmuramate dehydrogenase [Anaerococcus]MDU2591567.1 UDP-N-acetylmuramate dehydrogenase [Paeniclostridium sordellii]MBP2069332.1 UDP-N-acetylmuramate dehydrogenase [Anaerococcus nagyae]MDU1865051.1 UDP-N-acetylmuramate dehydrogenase [Anaerococcus sp.]MDU2354353.1 UDP-N-acetylmuramate dehydrogenase [Anaerococcus sp.]MDU2565979.1 UDP-N-acetylmuramate dehydrogenase [Anaerococcus sp.]